MQIVFLFYDGMTALDAIGPHEILTRLPNVIVKRVAKTSGNISTCSDVKLSAEYSIKDIIAADVLVIPGAGNATCMRDEPEILEWVKMIHETTTLTTSVCTGSLILGAAGLLFGEKATSHWAVLERLKAWGAEPVSERIVQSNKIITAAGVSAGIDMGLMLAATIAGDITAQTLQLGIEYDPEPPFDSGSPHKANPELVERLRSQLQRKFERFP